MATTIFFNPKAPEENIIELFDYTLYLEPNETLVSAVITCFVYRGLDPHPEQMVLTAYKIDGPVISQLVVGGRLNNIYNIKCLALTSLNQEIEIVGVLTINKGGD